MAPRTATRTAEVQTAEAQVEPTEEDKDRIATLDSVLGDRTIEVGRPEDVVPTQLQQQRGMVTVRVNTDIEDMSYVGGGRPERYSFEQGHVYSVPWYIADELEANGKVWH